MKARIESKAFFEALARVSHSADSKSTLPMCANVMIEAGDGALTLTCTDLTTRAMAHVAAEITEPGTTTTPAHDLARRVGQLEGTISLDIGDKNATIKAGPRKYKLDIVAADNFPNPPEFQANSPTFKLDAAVLRTLLGHTIYAASTDETRANLSSVHLSALNGILTCVTTDGHRLAIATAPAPIPEISSLVPLTSADEIRRLLHGIDGEVTITVTDARMLLTFAWGTFATQLVDATFPNYDAITRDIDQNASVAIVPRKEFLASLRVVAVAAPEHTGVVLAFDSGTLSVTCEGDAGGDELPVDYTREPQAVRCSARYLIETLQASDEDDIRFAFGGPAGTDDQSPILVRPVTGNAWQAIIMPMR